MVAIKTRSTLGGQWAVITICLAALGLAGCPHPPPPPPPPQTTIELFKTDSDGLLRPVTLEGEFWPKCKNEAGENRCLVERPKELPEDVESFSLVVLQTTVPGTPKQKTGGQTNGKQSVAASLGPGALNCPYIPPDGQCTVRWIFYPGVGPIEYWNPCDPDCPPL